MPTDRKNKSPMNLFEVLVAYAKAIQFLSSTNSLAGYSLHIAVDIDNGGGYVVVAAEDSSVNKYSDDFVTKPMFKKAFLVKEDCSIGNEVKKLFIQSSNGQWLWKKKYQLH